MFKKRCFRMSIVLTFVASIVFGTAINSAIAEKITITYWTCPYEGEYIKKYFLPKFESENPNIKVETELIAWDQAHDKVLTTIAAGEFPDVWLSLVRLINMIKAGIAEPLDAYLTKEEKEDYLISPSEIYQGKIYGVPAWYDVDITSWRKDIFKEAGYTRAPQTWEEVKEYAKKLCKDTDGDGEIDRWLFTLNCKGGWGTYIDVDPWLHMNGAKIFDLQTGEVEIDSEEAIEALQMYNDTFNNNICVPPEYYVEDKVAAFVLGTIVMDIHHEPWQIGGYREKAGAEFDKKYDQAITFKIKKRATYAGPQSYGISSLSKHKDAAWKLVQFLTSPENQVKMFKMYGSLPTRWSALNKPSIAEGEKSAMFVKALKMIKEGKIEATWEYCIPEFEEINEVLSDMVSAFAYQQKSVAEAAHEAARRLRKILKNYKR